MTVLVALTGASGRLCAQACAIAPGTTIGMASAEASKTPVSHASTGCHGEPDRGSRDSPDPTSHDCELRCGTSALMPDVEMVQGFEPSGALVARGLVAVGRAPLQPRVIDRLARRASPPSRSLLLMKSSLQI